MFPVLLAYGPVTITSLGVCLMLAFLWGSFDFWRRTREEHWDDQQIFDVVFLSLFGGLLGARLVYILLHLSTYAFADYAWLVDVDTQHLHWLGFILGTAYVLRLLTKHHKWSFFAIADMSVFGLVIAQIWLRLGQFLHGINMGAITTLPWGLVFPGQTQARHPLQLYDVIMLIGAYVLLRWIDKQYRFFRWYQDGRGKAKPGLVWMSYVGLYLLSQLVFDSFNQRQSLWGGITSYQLVLGIGLVLVLILFWLRSGRSIAWLGKLTQLAWFPFPPRVDTEPIRQPMYMQQPQKRSKRFQRSK